MCFFGFFGFFGFFFAFYFGMVVSNLLLFNALCRQLKTKFTKLALRLKKTSEAPSFWWQIPFTERIYKKQSFIDYKRTSTLISLERDFVAKSF